MVMTTSIILFRGSLPWNSDLVPRSYQLLSQARTWCNFVNSWMTRNVGFWKYIRFTLDGSLAQQMCHSCATAHWLRELLPSCKPLFRAQSRTKLILIAVVSLSSLIRSRQTLGTENFEVASIVATIISYHNWQIKVCFWKYIDRAFQWCQNVPKSHYHLGYSWPQTIFPFSLAHPVFLDLYGSLQ